MERGTTSSKTVKRGYYTLTRRGDGSQRATHVLNLDGSSVGHIRTNSWTKAVWAFVEGTGEHRYEEIPSYTTKQKIYSELENWVIETHTKNQNR